MLKFDFHLIQRCKNWWNMRKMDALERRRIRSMEKLEAFAKNREKYNDALRDELQRQEYLNKLHDIRKSTYTKKMVTWILVICMVDIQAVFIMAIFDKGAHLEGIVNNLTNTILGVSFIYMIRAYFDSRAEHKNMDEARMNALKTNLSGKITSILQSAGITNMTGEEFLNSSVDDEKSSRKFQIDINGVNISAGREAKPKPDLSSLSKLKHLNIPNKVKKPLTPETPPDAVG